MVFTYSMKNKDGRLVKGQLESDSKDKAIEYLHSQGGTILSLSAGKSKKAQSSEHGKVQTEELVIFSRQLTTLIESGIPVVGAFEILFDQTTNPFFKRIIGLIEKDLKEGSSLSGAIAKYPKIFSELYISMVEAAESSGNLPEILERLSVYLEKASSLQKKIISSMTYPVVVVIIAGAISSFLIFKVIPTFKEIFSSMGGKLPLPTQVLITISDVLRHWFLAVAIVGALIFFAIKRYIVTPKGIRQYHRLLLKLPIVGEIIQKVSISQFARTFSTLIRSGVPIITSLEIVSKTSGNTIIEDAVENAKKSVQEGVPISEPLEASGIFPPMVTKMIAVGEKTGKLEAMLFKVAQFYEEQTENTISSLTSLIEPLVIGFLGIVIGGIVVALFLPIVSITSMVSSGG
jgi:type IV pilus assembly protein PilC